MRSYRLTLLFIFWGLYTALAPTATPAQNLTPVARESGRAVASDGDSIRLYSKGHHWRVRLYGVDAPELPSPEGQWAKSAMIKILAEHQFRVACDFLEKDKYNRWIAICYQANDFTLESSINIKIIERGFARAYRYYLTPDNFQPFISAEKTAKKNK